MTPNFILLYAADVAASARFYGDILGKVPMEASPGFAMFEAAPGVRLGLWKKEGVVPAATAPGGFELGVPVASNGDVDATAAEWAARGISILQSPEDMDFGRTFTAADPDGHRIRVFCPGA